MQSFRYLITKVGKTRAIIFLILNYIFCFFTTNYFIKLFLPPDGIPWWIKLCVLIFLVLIWLIYFYYLKFVIHEKEELRIKEQADIAEDAAVVRFQNRLQTAETLIQSYLEVLRKKDIELNKLRRKVSKTSSPILIRRYLKKKEDFNYICFKIECCSAYLQANRKDCVENVKYGGGIHVMNY